MSQISAGASAPPLPSDLPTEGQYVEICPGEAPSFNTAAPPEHPYNAYKPARLNPDAVKALIAKWGEKNVGCCTSKKPLKNITVDQYETGAAYNYKFETFTETRSIGPKYEPHVFGSAVDGPTNGPAPTMWQMVIDSPQNFVESVRTYEVPHTAMVATCFGCMGMGQVQCIDCGGQGRTVCMMCHGSGSDRCFSCSGSGSCSSCHGRGSKYDSGFGDRPSRHETCFSCHGSGRCSSCHGCGEKRCFHCSGSGMNLCHTCGTTGMVTCDTCQGLRTLKHYQQLRVHCKVEQDNPVCKYKDASKLPDKVIRAQQGKLIMENGGDAVYPLTGFCEPMVDTISQQLSAKHAHYHGGDRIILAQRHNLRAIPVHSVDANGPDGKWRFWIVGTNHCVYCADYPGGCGCTIL